MALSVGAPEKLPSTVEDISSCSWEVLQREVGSLQGYRVEILEQTTLGHPERFLLFGQVTPHQVWLCLCEFSCRKSYMDLSLDHNHRILTMEK